MSDAKQPPAAAGAGAAAPLTGGLALLAEQQAAAAAAAGTAGAGAAGSGASFAAASAAATANDAAADMARYRDTRTYQFGEKRFGAGEKELKGGAAGGGVRCVLWLVDKSAEEKRTLVSAIRAEESRRPLGSGLVPVQQYQVQNALMPEQFMFIPELSHGLVMVRVTPEDRTLLEASWPVAHALVLTCPRCERTDLDGGYFAVQFVVRVMPDPKPDPDPLVIERPYKRMCASLPRVVCADCYQHVATVAATESGVRLSTMLPPTKPAAANAAATTDAKAAAADVKAGTATAKTAAAKEQYAYDQLPAEQTLAAAWGHPAVQNACAEYSHALLGTGPAATAVKSSDAAGAPPKGDGRGGADDDGALVECAQCHKTSAQLKAANAAPLQVCSGCRSVRYCSAACQTAHWKAPGGHKLQCKKLAAAAAAKPSAAGAPTPAAAAAGGAAAATATVAASADSMPAAPKDK